MRCFIVFPYLTDSGHSDQGRQFEGKIIEELKRHVPPSGDGLVERANRNMLATVVDDHKDWEFHLRASCMAYNTSV